MTALSCTSLASVCISNGSPNLGNPSEAATDTAWKSWATMPGEYRSVPRHSAPNSDAVASATIAAAVVTSAASRAETSFSVGLTESENGPTSSPKLTETLIRKRNAKYSRRHYYKKKNEVKDLQDQCNLLRDRQGDLQMEYERLSGLMEQAKVLVRESENG